MTRAQADPNGRASRDAILASLSLLVCSYLVQTAFAPLILSDGFDLIKIKRAIVTSLGAGLYWIVISTWPRNIRLGFPRQAFVVVLATLICALFLWNVRVALDAARPGDPLNYLQDAEWVLLWSILFVVWVVAAKVMEPKRVFDIAVAGALLVLSAPLMLLTALTIRLIDGTPVLFRQIRPGLNGAPFELLKFRTMAPRQDPSSTALDDGERLTTLGRFLRRTSLDELPQLYNVLKGDMSLVGPRPLLMHYLGHYTPEQARRHEVRPGITGLAQIKGRNELSWPRRFKYDVWYVDNHGLLLDLQLIAWTIVLVAKGRGVSAEGHHTAPYFVEPDEVGRQR